MRNLLIIILFSFSFNVLANNVSIKSAELSSKGMEVKLSIKHSGILNDNPRVEIKDNILNVNIPNSELVGKINKKINSITIKGKMNDEETVGVTVELPYSLKGHESGVAIALKDGLIDVSFPKIEIEKKSLVTRLPAIVDRKVTPTVSSDNAEAEKFDESYLSKIAEGQEKSDETKKMKKGEFLNKEDVKESHTQIVNVNQASLLSRNEGKNALDKIVKQESQPKFSMAGHVGKFVAFLGLMIAGIYGVLALFKKGIIKKGKLGFLHSTKLVEILSTTYVAPKKTLIMVKAHKQVFLISNTEAGIQFISEINDVSGLIKTGEEELTGSNFDSNLNSANKNDKQFKIKEDEALNSYARDYPMDSIDDMGNDDVPKRSSTNAANAIAKFPVKDQVRFSEQIKTKVKNLKQL